MSAALSVLQLESRMPEIGVSGSRAGGKGAAGANSSGADTVLTTGWAPECHKALPKLTTQRSIKGSRPLRKK